MQETDPLYQHVRQIMVEIMAVLYANGQRQLHLGAVMRLIGVDEDMAREHDETKIEIDENFLELASELNIQHLIRPRVPAGATIH